MKNQPNYYQLLHLHPDAPAPVVRAAYRTIMQKLKAHPDLGGDTDQAALINEAYAVLSNPTRRADYDRELAKKTASASQSTQTESNRTSARQQRNQRPSSRQNSGSKAHSRRTSHTNPQSSCPFCLATMDNNSSGDANCARCESPLTHELANQTNLAGAGNRRSMLRLPRSGPVTFCLQKDFDQIRSVNDFLSRLHANSYVAHALDVSLTGMRINTHQVFAEGTILRVEIDTLLAVATTVNRHIGAPGAANTYGLRFLTLSVKQAQGGFVSTAV